MFLRAVPYRNEAVDLVHQGGGDVVASVPIPKPRFLVPPLSWLLPFSRVRRVRLEPVGAAVLNLCDGRRTVEAVIESFAAGQRLSFREAQLPVTEFLRQLAQRGLVAIVGKDKDADLS
jgi:hypothetical protein